MPIPAKFINNPKIIPKGTPITQRKIPSYTTDCAICFFVAPTLFNMPNCAMRSPALTRKAFDTTITEAATIMDVKITAMPVSVLV
jgi:hypothetical protein